MNCNNCCYNLPKDGHPHCTYEEGECVKISRLEKENSSLRVRLNAINLLTPELEKQSEARKKQLTEAKEIIKILLKYDRGQFFNDRRIYDMYMSTRDEAKQFLKEE